jgi:hypothetical protein
MQEIIDKLVFIKIENFHSVKDTVKGMRWPSMMMNTCNPSNLVKWR